MKLHTALEEHKKFLIENKESKFTEIEMIECRGLRETALLRRLFKPFLDQFEINSNLSQHEIDLKFSERNNFDIKKVYDLNEYIKLTIVANTEKFHYEIYVTNVNTLEVKSIHMDYDVETNLWDNNICNDQKTSFEACMTVNNFFSGLL